MSTHRPSRIRLGVALRLLIVAAMLALLLVPMVASAQEAPSKARPASSPNGIYIVQLADPPVFMYDGGINGIPATAPDTSGQAGKAAGTGLGSRLGPAQPPAQPGGEWDANATNVRQYAGYLRGKQEAALRGVPGAQKVYEYQYTFNGFAARMTPAQAVQMSAQPGVLRVTPDEARELDTFSTPTFLGLDAPGGIWAQLGGPTVRAGQGVVVGIVDGGIWPESASFANDGSFRPILRFRGTCQTGEEWDASDCNGKIVGARYYNAGWGGNAGIDALLPYEYNSPRDFGGHGSHTASTAAGNYDVAASAEGIYFGQNSGMAPKASISVYKVCWQTAAGGSCFNSDSVAAIEQAALDRVDVINFSISGSRTSVTDPVEYAFLGATAAGVFVAASAGNSGPGATTVAHNSPWLTTVAAGSHDRDYLSTLTLGDGSVYNGKSLSGGSPMLPLILSTSAGLPGANATEVRLCFPGTLDPAVVTGKMVLCDRGVNARIDKSRAVKEAGGLAMVLTNTAPSSVNADLHFVPTIHVDEVAGAAIKAYITGAGAGATGQIAPGAKVQVEAPIVASFSSRGPALAAAGDFLKPDIMAPGVDVFAAVAPPGNYGRDFDFYSGTSMSSPHIAGIAALMKARYPSWSPAMIKSALMTTASQTTNAGNPIPGNAFAFGAGQVAPNAATDPGLVYNVRRMEFVQFLCTQGVALDPRCAFNAIPASQLNLPSIAVNDLAGVESVMRTVTNVAATTSTYNASIQGLAGFDVVVDPPTLTVAPGQSASFKVTFTRTSAPLNAYTFGALVWSDGTHNVRSPIALRPVALAAPGAVSGSGTSGSVGYSVTFGYDGDFSARPHGLVEATKFAGTVADDPTNTFVPGGPGTVSFDFAVPAGTELARFSLFDEYTDGDDDLDLYVYRGNTLVGSSGFGTSAEEVNLTKPTAGTYTAWVHGWQTDGPDANFTLFAWAITPADAGNTTVTAPSTASTGATASVTLNWSGLNAGTKYLGTVTYHNVAAPAGYDDGRIGVTVVAVDTD